MKPVRIKYYGLVWMTKRTYLILQGLVFLVLLILLPLTILYPNPRFGVEEQRLSPVQIWLCDHLAWIVLFTLVLEVLDAFFTLQRFAQKESEERQHDVVL